MEHRLRLGKYRLLAELARGGMGLVFLGSTSGPGGFSKLFVIKELKPDLAEDAAFLEMFLEEARLAAKLNHPNIVTTYEVGIDGTRPFIVMDFLDGQTLSRVLRKKVDGFTLEMHLTVLAQALDGLEYAHHQQNFDGSTTSIVHRDVSPQNVFITYDGQIKVVDFGIAKASDSTVETRTGVFKGKPAYMAPEQLQGEVTPRGDVYSIGVMLWEAVAGRRMWATKSDVEILTALLRGDIPSIDEAAPAAPAELRAICKKAIAREADARYASAKELRDAIDEHLKSAPRTTSRDIGAAIAAGFTAQRERLRGHIERCIAEAKAESAAASALPTIPPPEERTRLSAMGPFDAPSVGGARRLESLPPSQTPRPLVAESAPPTMFDPPEPVRSPRFYLAVGALAAVMLVGFGFLLSLTAAASADRHRDASRTSAEDRAPARPAPARPAPVDYVPPPASAEPSAPSSVAPLPSPPPTTSTTASAPPKHYVWPPAKPSAAPSAPSTADCNPPFYFEGTKKIFKSGCL